MRWEQNLDSDVNLRVEQSMDPILVLLADQLALIQIVLVSLIKLPGILELENLIDYVLIEIVVKRHV